MYYPDPFEFQPQPAKDTAWQMLMVRLGVTRRNKIDQRQQAAKVAGHAARDLPTAAAAMLSRLGRGS